MIPATLLLVLLCYVRLSLAVLGTACTGAGQGNCDSGEFCVPSDEGGNPNKCCALDCPSTAGSCGIVRCDSTTSPVFTMCAAAVPKCATAPCPIEATCTDTLPCATRLRGFGPMGQTCQTWDMGYKTCVAGTTNCATTPTNDALCETQTVLTAVPAGPLSTPHCGSVQCVKSGVCTAGSTTFPTMRSDLCFTSLTIGEGTCPNGGVCDSTGTCVARPLGYDCVMGMSQCGSNFCRPSNDAGNPTKCCALDCPAMATACETLRCSNTGYMTCASTPKCATAPCAVESGCGMASNLLPCNARLKGFNADMRTCESWSSTYRTCLAGTNMCATTPTNDALCEGATGVLTPQAVVSCGSVGCVKGTCTAGSTMFPTLGTLCFTNAMPSVDNNGCAATEYCNNGGTCTARVLNDPCDASADCPAPNNKCSLFKLTYDGLGTCCPAATGQCQNCPGGTPTFICNNANGCQHDGCLVANGGPGPVVCTDRVKGFATNGKDCEYFTGTRPPTCQNAGPCVSAPTVPYCTGVAVAIGASCVDVECAKACTAMGMKTSFDQVSEVCFTGLVIGEGSCPNGNVCDATGKCVGRPLGSMCTADNQCTNPGKCVDGRCCGTNGCPSCQQCTGAMGTCVADCGVATIGCPDTNTECAMVPACNNKAKGWDVTNTKCEFFQGTNEARCLQTGACATNPPSTWNLCGFMTVSTTPTLTCGHADCRKPTACALGTDTSTLNNGDVCFTSTQSCNSGMGVCTTGGNCLLNNGAMCSMDSQCQSTKCRQGRCCATECDNGCGSCDNTGTCVACTGGGCMPNMCSAVTISCLNKLKGWSSNDCVKWTADATNVKACDGSGRCVQNNAFVPSLCPAATVTAIGQHSQYPSDNMYPSGGPCRDANCLKSCVPGTAVATTLEWTTVCTADGSSCTGGNVCRAAPPIDVGKCLPALKANGATCSAGSECSSGICSTNGRCCATTCGPCGDCTTGTCSVYCTNANGCTPTAGSCPTITCNNIIKGFSATAQCEYYTATHAGICKPNTILCYGATEVAACPSPVPAEPAKTSSLGCGSTGCQRTGECVAGATYAYTMVSQLCIVDGTTQCDGDVNKACSSTAHMPNWSLGTCKFKNGAQCSNNMMDNDNGCLSKQCVQISASPFNWVCCENACTGQCSTCVAGTGVCTSCMTGPSTGCPTTFNSAACTPMAGCDQRVFGWSGNQCHRYSTMTNAAAKCTSANTCATNPMTDFAYCDSGTTLISAAAACADAQCKKACTPGALATSFDQEAEVCHNDGTTQVCDIVAGKSEHCTAGGACKLDNNELCAAGSECISTNCGGYPRKCCQVAGCDSTSGCFTCTGGTTCSPTCSNASGCILAMPVGSCSTAIACTNRIKGWGGSNSRFCQYYTADATGRCKNGGGCTAANDYAYCDTATNDGPGCGSAQCRRTPLASTCTVDGPNGNTKTVNDLCFTAGEAGSCPSNNVCDSTGTCKLVFGQTCTMGSQCASGICTRGKCCAQACGPCTACDAAGVCQPTCADAVNGCLPTMGDCSGQITCTDVLKGWSGKDCTKYSSNVNRLCRPSKQAAEPDLCTPTNAYSFCTSTAQTAPTSTVSVSCGSMGCVDSTKCQPLAAVATGDTVVKVCFISGAQMCPAPGFCTSTGTCNDPGGLCTTNANCASPTPYCEGATTKVCCDNNMCSHPCQQCPAGTCGFRCTNPLGCAEATCSTQITCNNLAKGWNSNVCEKFTANEAGKCKNLGLCTAAGDSSYCNGAGSAAATCVDTACRDTSKCIKGSAAPTAASQVCFEDGVAHGCPAGDVCSTGGRCLKDVGQACVMNNECHTGQCMQGYCCQEACGAAPGMDVAGNNKLKECFRCDLAGTLGTCRANTGVDCGGSVFTTECSDRLSGWVSVTQCHRYLADTSGVCAATGICDTTVQNRCQTKGVTTGAERTCGSAACVDGVTCQQYDVVTGPSPGITLDAVCKVSVPEAGCPSIRCNEYMAGWNGRSCELYGQTAVSGQCDNTATCSPTNTPAALGAYCPSANRFQAYACGSAQCTKNTQCQPNVLRGTEAVADGCNLNTQIMGCPDIDCTTTTKGWQGAACMRYNAPHTGYCDNVGACASTVTLCQSHTPALAVIAITGGTCPTANCIDPTKCLEGQPSSNNDAIAKVCLVNAPSLPCPDLTCNNKVAGINAKTCERFVSNSMGHCDATSNCITQCTEVPSQTRQAIATCGSVECIRPGACPAGAATTAWDSTAEFCFVGDEAGSCPLGAKCDATGTCYFTGQGGSCMIDDNCISKFCWKDPTAAPTALGICCSEACKADCQECKTTPGQCKSRTGQSCAIQPYTPTDTPLQCPDYIKGWGTGTAAAARQCLKYSRTRDQECNAAAQCRADPALCEAMPAVTLSASHLQPCANTECKKGCPPLATIVTVSQNDICFTNEVQAACPDIPCTGVISGWSNNVCRKWNLDHTGYCFSAAGATAVKGQCSTDVTLCSAQVGQTEITHRQCGSQQCNKDAACQRDSLVSAQPALGDVCVLSSAVARCTDIPCSSKIKGWNANSCDRYAQDHSGYCTATGTCDTADQRCETNTGLGAGGTGATSTFSCSASACRKTTACQQFDALPTALGDVCFINVAQDLCPDIPCSTTVAGWSGKICNRYNNDFKGWCLADTSCDTAVDRCDNPEATSQSPAVAPVKLTECGSMACVRSTACQQFTTVATSDTIGEVCFTAVDRPACNPPFTFPCNEFVTGWGTGTRANVCEKYSLTSPGHCDATGTCINQCSAIPSQTTRTHLSCGSVGCVNPAACTAGKQANVDYPAVSDICFTDKLQHNCQAGATCNSQGACVFADDGLPCQMDIQCASKHCYFGPGATEGICCNQACDNECQECASTRGTCKPRTGASCSTVVPCDTVLKGFLASSPNKCERYKDPRQGECTDQGVCGAAIALCTGLPGVDQQRCNSAQCAKYCDRFQPLTTADTLQEVCYTNVERSDCVDIDCPAYLAGWRVAPGDPTVCEKYAQKHPGYCDQDSNCAQSPEQCKNTAIVTREAHIQCGEPKCVKAGGCTPGNTVLSFFTLADVCIVNTATSACDTLACSTRISGWKGRTCEKYNLDSPGFCNDASKCETNFDACATKGIIGEEHVRCGNRECTRQCPPGAQAAQIGFADACIVSEVKDECDDIICTLFVKGWNGRVCERYKDNLAGYCDDKAVCSQSVDFCSGVGVPIPQAECGSVECTRQGGCAPGSPIAGFADQLAGVCDLNRANDACPALACTTQLAGWNGNVCTRWTRDSSGYCDGTGTCERDCSRLPAQDRVENIRCGSIECKKPNVCAVGAGTVTANAVSDVCFTDSAQHGCPAGAVCNSAGACSFPDGAKKGDNSLCGASSECASGFCVTSNEKMNICCNRECSGECEECVSGKCQPKVGALCGDKVCKVCDESGKCQAKTTLCAETDVNNMPLFGCNQPPTTAGGSDGKQCQTGACVTCVPPPTLPPIYTKANVTEIVNDCIENLDCGLTLEQGKCMAGKCVCGPGYSGKYCTDVTCPPGADGGASCNSANGGGTCTGPNTCTCNSGYSPPNCAADCTNVDNCELNGVKTGFCVSADVCQCFPGYSGANCQTMGKQGQPCADDSACEGAPCYKENVDDAMGVCCAQQCSGECSTCAGLDMAAAKAIGLDTTTPGANGKFGVGFCHPRANVRCGDATEPCRVCQRKQTGAGGECGPHSSLCAAQGGLAGTDFGCPTADEYCFEGACKACTGGAQCGADATFTIDFKSINVRLPFQICVDSSPIDVSCEADNDCVVAWQPDQGVGVDCVAADGQLTAPATANAPVEKLLVRFVPPLQVKLVIKFRRFEAGIDKARVTVHHKPMSSADAMMRKRQMGTTGMTASTGASTTSGGAQSTTDMMSTMMPTAPPAQQMVSTIEIDTADFMLDPYEDITLLEFEALAGAFELEQLTSVGLVNPPTTTTPATTVPPQTTVPNTTVPQATQPPVEETTEAPGFGDRLAAAFRGEDDTILGAFIGVVAFLVLCIVGIIVVAVVYAKKKKADKKLFDAYGEGKPMQSFETVTAKPSTALGDDSDDEQPFGILSTPSAPTPMMAGTVGGDEPRVGIKVEPLTDSDDSE